MLRGFPVDRYAREHAPTPSLRNELVEQNERPAHCEERKISAKARYERWIRPIEPLRAQSKSATVRLIKRHSRMQQDIGGQFHRVIPAKVLEINECQRAIRPAQAVVKAEVRRHK